MSTHAPEIQAVINNYLRAADRADIDLLKTCYHDDAWEDHGGVYDGPAADYVAIMAKVLPKGGIMNHLATNVIIELDGGQHSESDRDGQRDAWLRSENFRILRVWNNELTDNRDGVLEAIWHALHHGASA